MEHPPLVPSSLDVFQAGSFPGHFKVTYIPPRSLSNSSPLKKKCWLDWLEDDGNIMEKPLPQKKSLRHLQDLKAFVDHGEEHSFNDLLDGLKDDFRGTSSQTRGSFSAL